MIVQKRHQMSQENVICPLCLALPFIPALFQLFYLHVAGKEQSRLNACQTSYPRKPRKDRESPWQWQVVRDTQRKGVNVLVGGTSTPTWAGSAATSSRTRAAF